MTLHRSRFRVLLVAALLFVPACSDSNSGAQSSDTPHYRIAASRHEDGTGKFYMGREIARITEHASADWLERPNRETLELPTRVIKGLDLSAADVVADIGAGTGYFTFRLCERVPHGRVYAVDVQQEMLDVIERRVAETGERNVVTVLGTPENPNLPPESVDLALMVDAYHEFSHPREMMENIVASLKPGGTVVLVEYRAEDATIPVQDVHRMSESQARREMSAVGLLWRETKDILPQQHFMVFEKPVEPSEPGL